MTLPDNYILDANGEPVVCADLFTWAMWMESADRCIAEDIATLAAGTVARVSTIFLGFDHGFGGGRAPVLWETMIFGGDLHHFQQRYRSKADALEGHRYALASVQAGEFVQTVETQEPGK